MLKHEPETPCRTSVYGEGIFLGCWQRLMAVPPEHSDGEPDDRFISIYGHRLVVDFETYVPFYNDESVQAREEAKLYVPRQRCATVAASFIAWLGTNCGACFLLEADRLDGILSDARHHDRWESYLFAWAHQNRRRAGWGNLGTTAEAIVKKPDATDLEVMAVTAEWLGLTDGQRLIADAMKEIELTRALLRDQNALQSRVQQRVLDMKEKGIAAF